MNVAHDPSAGLAFVNNSTMERLVRAHDWSATPIGAIERWPLSLRTAVGLMLEARQPAYIAWGPAQTSLYNDHYIPILGSKHPAGLGLPARELWSEIWETLGPLNAAVLAGQAQYFEDMPFALAGPEACRCRFPRAPGRERRTPTHRHPSTRESSPAPKEQP